VLAAQIRKQTQHGIVIEHPLEITRYGARQSEEANTAAGHIYVEHHPLARCPQQRCYTGGSNKPA
jgi:hypothetical protein